MKSKSSVFCNETCIVVDHNQSFLNPSGSKINLDPVQKRSAKDSFLHGLAKSSWTCVVEGISEYCRIVFDLFDTTCKVLVLCSDVDVSSINQFDDEYQNIQQVLKGFGELGPPGTDNEGSSTLSVYTGVAQGTEELIKHSSKQIVNRNKRLVVVTTGLDENNARSIGNVVWEMQNQHDKNGNHNIDLVVVNISDDAEIPAELTKQISGNLHLTMVTFKPAYCSSHIALLVREHFNLKSTIVTGIPMKEEQNAGTSANYDVEVIHSSLAHHLNEYTRIAEEPNKEDSAYKDVVTLKWCTPKANNQHELLPCLGAYKITPAEVNSRPAACLIMFLLQGRLVMLEEPKKAGSKVLSHMLSSHGGDVYIHTLVTGRNPLDDPPSISEGIGGRVTDYRINDFGKFMKENRLAPYGSDDDCNNPNSAAMARLDRYSKHWPMVISDTLIFNMQPNLEPLLSALLKPSLTDSEVQDCKKVIYKLQSMESRNDTLPLPIVTLKGKNTKKEEQYKQLWAELDVYIEGASTTSPNHKKILDCIRGTLEAEVKQEVTDPRGDPRKAEPSSEKEVVKIERMDVDKKSMNVIPSDPRRKRRNSEGSGRGGEIQQSVKSPRYDESPSKFKRSNALSSLVQGKSSLLSLWTDHLNLQASRLHEEFHGRKQAVNGKFELYQKEADDTKPNESSAFMSKTVKEWV